MASDVVVLGGGNTAFAVAAKLAIEGARVTIWEHPEYASTIDPIRDRRTIRLTGVGGTGSGVLHKVTTDAGEALAESHVLFAPVPSYAHVALLDALAPYITEQHALALLPGNGGTLAMATSLRRRGQASQIPLLVESDTAPYVCRKLAPDLAHIWGVVPAMGIGVLPARRTTEALAKLEKFFPGTIAYPHVLGAALGAMNPIMHPVGVLMNAGRIEYARGDFYFYEEGVTPGVVRVIEAVDTERRAVGEALGLELMPVADAFHHAGFGPKGDLWQTINGSRMLTPLKAPGSLESRWMTEDLPYGLRMWVAVGECLGVPMPVSRSVIALGAIVMQSDPWTDGRTAHDLGIEVPRDEILALLDV